MNRKTDKQARPAFKAFIHTVQAERGTFAAAAHLRARGVNIQTALRLLAPGRKAANHG